MPVINSIRKELSNYIPDVDFSLYFDFLDSCPERQKEGSESHHILPKSVFPLFKKSHANLIFLSPENHFKAHYWLAVCAPKFDIFQYIFYWMANKKVYQVTETELSNYAEIYERGRVAQKVITSRTQKARCKEQSKLVTEYNLRENSKLRDFKCDKCGTEFKQVTKGVYGGHRRSCRHYSGKPPLIRPFVLPSNEQTKRCGKCGTDKHLDEFNNQRTGRLGKANFCRLCARQHNRDKTAEAKSGTIKNETNALKDYTCPNCDKEFKQVKPGVFGGHRKNCINYSGRKEEFLKWSGSIQEFANLHELPFQTVWRWHLNRK